MLETFHTSPVTVPRNLAAAVRTFCSGSEAAWLDGGTHAFRSSGVPRRSVITRTPLAVLEQLAGEPARLRVRSTTVAEAASAWELWRHVQRRLPPYAPHPTLAPGWIGYLGFEAVHQLDKLAVAAPQAPGLPLVRLALFDQAITLNHDDGTAQHTHAPNLAAALGALFEVTPQTDAAFERDWRSACDQSPGPFPVHPRPTLTTTVDRAEHERRVARALEYIAAGDVYQVNLAHPLRLSGCGDAWDVFTSIRSANPAPYSALLTWDGGAVASFSPELFLHLDRDRVLTRPIKGTRPRCGEMEIDEPAAAALLASRKEAAELAMVVDLHRNDLGRVCEYGSVRVVHPRRLETHPTVYHTVADVAGILRPECDAIDLIAAAFPAGSVTGVPKLRALEIIAELEQAPRGVYTGSIGALGLGGRMTMNVAIRTLQIRGDEATLYVGGGIVAESNPTAEYDETLAKAAGILRGLGLATPHVQTPEFVVAPQPASIAH
ncbi:MAG: anthranilate synthase component I family protein [Phycisphaerales bacterium]|nr:anthranilate synthase component I family protein [Phycisphaerales bacterium]